MLAKWLKDRREQRLTLKEIKTYGRVVTAIRRSIALQEKINALCPEAGKQVVEMADGTRHFKGTTPDKAFTLQFVPGLRCSNVSRTQLRGNQTNQSIKSKERS